MRIVATGAAVTGPIERGDAGTSVRSAHEHDAAGTLGRWDELVRKLPSES